MLKEGKPVGLIRSAFIIVNYSTLLFVSLVIYRTTDLVCERFEAYELISTINHIPVQPKLLIAVTQLAFLLIILTIWIRGRDEIARPRLNLFFSLTDLFLALVILYFISLSHKGILFLVITNTVVFTRGRKRKYILLGLPILLYMFLDSDLIASRISLYSLDGYLDFYDANARFLLLAVRNLLFSANEVLFIIFMILEIQTYLEETRRVKELNAALYESSEQLRISNTQLKEYALRNEDMARLKERNRLAREIHDTIGHYLTAMDMGVKTCLHLIEKSPDLVKGHLEKVNSLTKRSLSDVRRSIKELQPDALSRYSLIPALEELATEISSVSRTKVTFEVRGEPFRLSSQLEEFIYRAMQEGISNSVRHGAATRIGCSLGFRGDAVDVCVEDNGKKGGEPARGFGLTHLEQKTEELSGRIDFGKKKEGGFFLHITIPQSRREHFDQSADS